MKKLIVRLMSSALLFSMSSSAIASFMPKEIGTSKVTDRTILSRLETRAARPGSTAKPEKKFVLDERAAITVVEKKAVVYRPNQIDYRSPYPQPIPSTRNVNQASNFRAPSYPNVRTPSYGDFRSPRPTPGNYRF